MSSANEDSVTSPFLPCSHPIYFSLALLHWLKCPGLHQTEATRVSILLLFSTSEEVFLDFTHSYDTCYEFVLYIICYAVMVFLYLISSKPLSWKGVKLCQRHFSGTVQMIMWFWLWFYVLCDIFGFSYIEPNLYP